MNLADCRTLDELSAFVKAKVIYAVDLKYREIQELDPSLYGITFEIKKNPLSFYVHYSGGMTYYDNVFINEEEARQYLTKRFSTQRRLKEDDDDEK